AAGLQVVVAEHVVGRDGDRQRPGRLDLADAGRRAEVVDDAVAPPEPLGGDDLLVEEALALVPRGRAVGGVPLRREAAALEAGGPSLELVSSLTCARCSGVARATSTPTFVSGSLRMRKYASPP